MTSAPVHPAIAGDAGWQRATREFIDALRKHYGERLHAVVLFGSRARGDAHETESDVDLLVVLNGEFDHNAEGEAVSALKRAVDPDYNYWLFGLVASVYEYRQRMLPIYMNIRREGFELWPTPATKVGEQRSGYDSPSKQDLQIVLDKARQALGDAEFALEHHGLDAATNRAYYVMFHAASALLLSEGFAFSKHQGVIGGLREHFIKTGKLPGELSAAIGDAFDARNKADYSYRERIGADQARALVERAAQFLASSEQHLDLRRSED